jgi:tripartite-type tricarboxylate transporter receptor subunit TctC
MWYTVHGYSRLHPSVVAGEAGDAYYTCRERGLDPMKRTRSLAIAMALTLLAVACGNDEPDETAATEEEVEATDDADADTEEVGDADADEPWPSPLTIYVPAPAGGGFDILVRALQPMLEEEMGNSIVVENIEGAGGAVAGQQMLSEPSDGSRIMIVSRTIMGVPYTGTPEVDPLTVFAPLGMVSEDVSAVTVPVDSPNESIEDFIEAARENPGGLQVGNSGIGSVWHSAALLLQRDAEVEFDHVPYQGGAPAAAALAAGELDAITTGAPEVVGLVDAGEARVLAVMGEERSHLFPDTPTLIEEGHDVVYAVWRGFVTNADVPGDVQEQLVERIERAVTSDEYAEAMAELGFEVEYRTPDEALELMEEEDVTFRELYEGADFMNTEPERIAN